MELREISTKLLDDFSYAYSLCQECLKEDQVPIALRDEFVTVVFDLFDSHQLSLDFLQYLIHEEIESTTESSSVLRGESIAAVFLRNYFNNDLGQKYLKKVLNKSVNQICSDHHANFSLNTQEVSEEEVYRNVTEVLEIANQLLDTIVNTISHCPLGYREVLCYLKEEVCQKFPSETSLVTAQFFLRYICPALTQPRDSGLILEAPTPGQRTMLITIGKLLQYLANDSNFMVAQPFHDRFNAFIESNRGNIKQFLTELLDKEQIEMCKTVIASSVKINTLRANAARVQSIEEVEKFIQEHHLDLLQDALGKNGQGQRITEENVRDWKPKIKEFLETENHVDWKLYLHNKKQQLFWRPVGNGCLAVKTSYDVQTTADQLWNFLLHPDAMKLDALITSVEKLEQLGSGWDIVRTEFKLPWPLSKRDALHLRNYQFNNNCKPNTPGIDASFICGKAIPFHPDAPEKRGILRMTHDWAVIIRPNGEYCRVTTLWEADLRTPKLPTFMANKIAKGAAPTWAHNMRKVGSMLQSGQEINVAKDATSYDSNSVESANT